MKISIYARYNLATGFHIHDIIIQQEAMKPHSQYYAHFIIPWRMLQRYDIVNCLKMKKITKNLHQHSHKRCTLCQTRTHNPLP